jgi:SAM-dependent methyltransferase
MHDDVLKLCDFYRTPLGLTARRIVASRIRRRWRDVRDMDVIGLGFAAPYLHMFHEEARGTLALMPEQQGVIGWPQEGPFRSTLVPETKLPLRDMCAERVLAVHGLEHVESRQAYLREIWRILMPQGRVIFVVPNRRGAWARLETTPWGYGRPYSPRQLEKVMAKAMLKPVSITPCLFMPPLRWRVITPAALAWERFGAALWPAFSGVLIVEAMKQVHAGLRVTARKPIFAPVPVLPGLRPAGAAGRASEPAFSPPREQENRLLAYEILQK